MIAIVNVDKNPRKTGIHEYEVRINHDVICRFTHYREDGLAECLLLASQAVEEHQGELDAKMLEALRM